MSDAKPEEQVAPVAEQVAEPVTESVPEPASTEVASEAAATTEAPAEPATEADATAENGENTVEEKKEWSRKNNTKFDPTVMPITDDHTKIRAQVEFYFGDHNLHTDEYMQKLSGGTDNKPVLIADLHKFKRMQRFQPYSAVVAALKESQFLVVSGPEGRETVKRKNAWDPRKHTKDGREARSVYVKGFGDEEPSTQFDIEAFFAPYGPYNAVRLRRSDEDKTFKGSVFVEFADEETAKKFLALDPKPKYKDQELKIMSKKDYVEEKAELIRTGQMEPSTRLQQNKRGRGRGGFNKGNRDNWKDRRDNDRKGGFRGGRGRGGRGGNRGGDRRDRNNDRSNRRDEAPKEEKRGDPTAAAIAAESKAEKESLKRSREDDGASGAPPAKKVDVDAS